MKNFSNFFLLLSFRSKKLFTTKAFDASTPSQVSETSAFVNLYQNNNEAYFYYRYFLKVFKYINTLIHLNLNVHLQDAGLRSLNLYKWDIC
jgi:hypothetical protein